MRSVHLWLVAIWCVIIVGTPADAAMTCNPNSPSECISDTPACRATAIDCFRRNPDACRYILQNCAPTGKLRTDAQAIVPQERPAASESDQKPPAASTSGASQAASCIDLLSENRTRKGSAYFSGQKGLHGRITIEQWDNLTFENTPHPLTPADIRNGIEERQLVIVKVGIERQHENGAWTDWKNSRITFACQTRRIKGALELKLFTVTPLGTLVPPYRVSEFPPDLAGLPLE